MPGQRNSPATSASLQATSTARDARHHCRPLSPLTRRYARHYVPSMQMIGRTHHTHRHHHGPSGPGEARVYV